MQFQRTAPGVVPFVIEIDDQVQASMPLLDRMAVEIDMRVEILAIAVLVRAAAEIPRIVEQIRNAGDAADQVEKFARLHQVVERGVGAAQATDLLDRRLVAEFAGFVARIAAVRTAETARAAARSSPA